MKLKRVMPVVSGLCVLLASHGCASTATIQPPNPPEQKTIENLENHSKAIENTSENNSQIADNASAVTVPVTPDISDAPNADSRESLPVLSPALPSSASDTTSAPTAAIQPKNDADMNSAASALPGQTTTPNIDKTSEISAVTTSLTSETIAYGDQMSHETFPASMLPQTNIVLPDGPQTHARELALSGDFKSARAAALDALRTGNTDASEVWLYVDSDPELTQTLDEQVRPHGSNAISALGGGSTVSFKYTDANAPDAKAAIKPDQDLRQTMYRSGVAYYRLCQILECSFDVARTRPVRWTKSDFNALYNASDSKKNNAYRSKFEHLIWAKEEGKTYLYGGYKEWIPDFEGFPIEVQSAWAIYQQPHTTQYPEMRPFLKNILAGGRSDASRSLDKLLAYVDDISTKDLLKQISDMILIDYLTNNWDRYSGVQSNYGANCHIRKGGLIAIDNDAAFPAWHAPRVVKRLHQVKVFSRSLVENLRLLDPDELLPRLIPNPTKEERKSYERFKERRKDALKYIDGLIAKYGEENILVY